MSQHPDRYVANSARGEGFGTQAPHGGRRSCVVSMAVSPHWPRVSRLRSVVRWDVAAGASLRLVDDV